MYIRNFLTLLRRYTTSSVLNIVGMAVAFAAVYTIVTVSLRSWSAANENPINSIMH